MEDVFEHKIREGLKMLASKYGPDAIIPVTVSTVDNINYTCDCITDDEIEIPGVLYKNFSDGIIDFITEPALNSRIWIGRIADSDEWLLLRAGVLNKVHIKVGESEFELTNDCLKLNGGTNGGLVKKDALTDKLNALENSLNAFKDVLKAWVPAAGDGGAALKTGVATWAGSELAKTIAGDLENTKILQ